MQISIKLLYDLLYARYGDTGWWPADSRDEVIIGTILTQNTSWKNVEISLGKMKRAGIANLLALSYVNKSYLGEIIRSSGFYNQKSERLITLSRNIIQKYGTVEEMMGAELAELTDFLGKMKGIGQETLDSILLYALDKPVFVVDKYTARILSRVGIKAAGEVASIKNLVSLDIGNDLSGLKNLHGMIVYLAKDFCKTKPKCIDCPISGVCDYGISLKSSD